MLRGRDRLRVSARSEFEEVGDTFAQRAERHRSGRHRIRPKISHVHEHASLGRIPRAWRQRVAARHSRPVPHAFSNIAQAKASSRPIWRKRTGMSTGCRSSPPSDPVFRPSPEEPSALPWFC